MSLSKRIFIAFLIALAIAVLMFFAKEQHQWKKEKELSKIITKGRI